MTVAPVAGDAGPAPPRLVTTPDGDLRTLARSGALALAGTAVSAITQLALVVVVTRGLGATGAGVFLQAVALFTILAAVAQFGANTGVVRFLPRARALGRTSDVGRLLAIAVAPVLVAGVVAGAGLYALAPHVSSLFLDDEPGATGVVRMFAAALPLAPATIVLLAATRGLGTMLPYVLVQNVGLPLLRLALVLIAIGVGLGGTAVALGWTAPLALAVIVAATAAVLLVRRARRHDRGRSGRPRSLRRLAVEFWRFSAARGLAGVLGMTVTWVDVLLVGALRSPREAGIYAAASRLSIAGAYALQAVGMAIAPRISALLARERRDRVESLYRVATWWLMALTWPLYVTLIVFSGFVMGLFGAEFEAGRAALVVLSAAMLVNLATGNVTVVLLMSGNSALNLINAAVSLALNVSLNVLLIPPLGMTGAALAWAVSLLYINLAPLVQVWLVLGIRPPIGAGYGLVAIASVACFGLPGAAAAWTLDTSAAVVAGCCGIGALAYAAVLARYRHLLELGTLRGALRR